MKTKEEIQAGTTYNKIAELYHNYRTKKFKGGWFFNEYLEMPAMLKALGNVKRKKILDWGCGSGIYAKLLTKKGALVKGFDISEEMLKIARKDNPSLDLRLGSGLKIPFNEKFDIVFASLAMHYLKDWDKAFREVSRVLKKGGFFLFSDGNPIVNSSRSMLKENLKVKVLGQVNYFKEQKQFSDWEEDDHKIRVVTYPKTYRSIISTINKNGFELIDYFDLKPIKSAKKQFPEEYSLWSKIPKFVIWKLRKK